MLPPLFLNAYTIRLYLITILVGIVGYIIIQYFWKRRWLYYYASKVPGPPGRPIIGNAMQFYGKVSDTMQIYSSMLNIYKSPMKLWMGPRLLFVVSKPNDLQIILNQALEKDKVYQFLKNLTGSSIFISPVNQWKQQRRMILPAFTQKLLNSYINIFADQANILIRIIDNEIVSKGIIDIFPVLNRCSLDIICETAMGKELHTQTHKSNYEDCFHRTNELYCTRIVTIWYHPNFLWNLTSLSVEEKHLAGNLKDLVRKIFIQRKNDFYQRPKHSEKVTDDNGTKRKPKVFLDYMIELSEAGNQLTEKEIIDEALTLIIGGTDSTASMESFALIMMGMHTNLQNKVYEELYNVFGNSNRNATVDDLRKLIYLERVIKETMRLFPLAPMIARALHDNIKLESHILPKGSSCMLNIFHLHRDPIIWPNPLTFDPDRFLPEEIAKRHPYSYLPFSGGPRNCVGPRYAMMAMKTILSRILRNFKVTTDYQKVSDVKIRGDSILIRCVDGYKVAFERRTILT